jgi:DNA-binding NtrC family response regulator
LRNCLQLACGLSQGNTIDEDSIHFMRRVGDAVEVPKVPDIESLAGHESMRSLTVLEQYEASLIAGLLEKYQGNRKLIAAEMNVSERTLYRKLNRLNLN